MCGVKALIANNLLSTTLDGMRLVRSEKEKPAQENGEAGRNQIEVNSRGEYAQ